MMDLDSILKEIGEFGVYQVRIYVLICLPVVFSAANSLTYVFTAAVPDYRCFVPECDTITTADGHTTSYDQSWLSMAIPPRNLSRFRDVYRPEQCQRYVRNASAVIGFGCRPDLFTSTVESCERWVFDPNERTIVNDWMITCPENQWKLSLVGTMHFAGIAIGTVLFGFLADKYGRKLIFIVSIFIMSITGVAQTVSYDYHLFLIFALLNAIGTAGVYPLAFILGVEMVGKNKRIVAGVVLNYFYAVGEALVGAISWFTRDWVILQLIASAPPIVFIVYYWILPESARWLMAKKKYNEANKIIQRAALGNGVIWTPQIRGGERYDKEFDNEGKVDILTTLKAVVVSKRMLIRMAILLYLWSANALIYYGLSLNSVNLSGNKYLNFILVCLIEIPGYTLSWYLMDLIGRKWSQSSSMFVCGVTCWLAAFFSGASSWLSVTLFLVGKFAITSSFGIIYVYSAEVLPTIIRSGGTGFLSTGARFAALIAPFVPLLEYIDESIPLLLFGSVAFFGGLVTLLLPETLGCPLPDTVKEAEELSGKVPRPACCKSSKINVL